MVEVLVMPAQTDNPELWADWLAFKETPFYGNIIQHAGIANEGVLWSVFYKGWEIGNDR
jgi:hypothetical protein